MNGDGIEDLITGSYYGDRNVKTRADGSPRRDENGNHWGDIFIFYGNEDGSFQPRQLLTNAFMHPAPFPVDWDGDGDYDFVTTTWAAGDYKAQISLMENTGTKQQPKFAHPVPLVTEGHYASVLVYDWDSDGLQDLIAGGSSEGSIFFFKNIGTKNDPKFDERKTLIQGLKSSGKGNVRTNEKVPWGNYLHLYLTDWDGDGVMDILAGDNERRKEAIYGLSKAETRRVADAQNRLDTHDETYMTRLRKLYVGLDYETLSDDEKKSLQKEERKISKEMIEKYPADIRQDRQLVSKKVQTMGRGRIWVFRGVRQ